MKKGFLKTAFKTIAGLLFVLIVLFLLLQTPFSKSIAAKIIRTKLKETTKAEMSIGKIEGIVPFKITFLDITLKEKKQTILEINKISVYWNVIPYLIQSSLICDIYASGIKFNPIKNDSSSLADEKPSSFMKWPKLPFMFTSIRYSLDNIEIDKSVSFTGLNFKAQGQFNAFGGADDFYFDIKTTKSGFEKQRLYFSLTGDHLTETISVKLDANELFHNVVMQKLELKDFPNYHLYVSSKGSYKAWQRLMDSKLPFGKQGIDTTLFIKAQNQNIKKENFFTEFFGKNNFQIESQFEYVPRSNTYIKTLEIKSENASLYASGTLTNTFKLDNLSLNLHFEKTELISPYIEVELEGPLNIKGVLNGNLLYPTGFITLKSPHLRLLDIPFDDFNGKIISDKEENGLEGSVSAKGDVKGINVNLKSPIIMKKDYSCHLTHLIGNIGKGKIEGDLAIETDHPLLRGTLHYDNGDISEFSKPYNKTLSGMLTSNLKLDFKETEDDYYQQFIWDASFEHFVYNDLWFSKLEGQCDFKTKWLKFYRSIQGTFSVNGQDFKYENLTVKKASGTGSMEFGKLPFSLSMDGKFKEDIKVDLDGTYTILNDGYSLQVSKFEGVALKHDFNLENPFQYYQKSNLKTLDPVNLTIGNGSLSTRFDIQKTHANFSIKGNELPLNFATLFTPYIDAEGTINIESQFVQTSLTESPQGKLSLSFNNIKIKDTESQSQPLKGSLHANLDQDNLIGSFILSNKRHHKFAFSCALPVKVSLLPLSASLIDDKEMNVYLTYKGTIDSSLKLLLPQNHLLTGDVLVDLKVIGLVEDPLIQGFLSLKNASYENVYTGLVLKNLDSRIVGEGNKLVLKEFTATDGIKGSVKANGNFFLNPKQNFPYICSINITSAELLKLDNFTAKLDGHLNLTGNFNKAYLTGDLTVDKANFTLPGKTPDPLPELEVTYVNPIPFTHCRIPSNNTRRDLPLNLDLNIKIPGPAFVSGRGLNTTWKGKANISGSDQNPIVKGELELVTGKFFFANRTLNLEEGQISINGDPEKSTFVYLVAETDVRSTKVEVILKGPIDAPKLTFQSDPALSQSAILALLLYDKDIEELTPFQAVGLARTAANLSGSYSGPDMVERLRRNIGLDQLSFSTEENSLDKVNVQLGKYINRNVFVTVNHGVTYQPTEWDVAAHFSYGWQFQAKMGYMTISELLILWKYSY